MRTLFRDALPDGRVQSGVRYPVNTDRYPLEDFGGLPTRSPQPSQIARAQFRPESEGS